MSASLSLAERTLRRSRSPLSLDRALWRAVGVYRALAWCYACFSMSVHLESYARPTLGLVLLAGMLIWTVLAGVAFLSPRFRTRMLLTLDLLITASFLLASILVLEPDRIQAGDPTITVSWAATPVIAWAVSTGRLGGAVGGAVAAAVIAAATVLERSGASFQTVNSCVLLVLVGTCVGYVVSLARAAEADRELAVRTQAATAERERLARAVHDGVLQVLAMTARDGEPRLATLASDAEQALRQLISRPLDPPPAGETDLAALLLSRPGLELALPAAPVLLSTHIATELAAAVSHALDNAFTHGATHVWLFVEDTAEEVVVSVRDDGPGIPEGRLAEAEAAGRLGFSRSIQGRVGDLGGSLAVTSSTTPPTGTEIEITIPRPAHTTGES